MRIAVLLPAISTVVAAACGGSNLQVHVSRPDDLEFRAMFGSVGAFGVITEIVLAVEAGITFTTVNTVIDKADTDLLADVQSVVQVGVWARLWHGVVVVSGGRGVV